MVERKQREKEERQEAGEERRRKLLLCEQITNVEGSAGSVGKHFTVHEKVGSL